MDGYSAGEVDRGIASAEISGFIVRDGEQVEVASNHLPTAKKLLLLDLIARAGHGFDTLIGAVCVALVPGYGPYYGLTLAELEAEIRGSYSTLWPDGFMADLHALCTHGWVVLR